MGEYCRMRKEVKELVREKRSLTFGERVSRNKYRFGW